MQSKELPYAVAYVPTMTLREMMEAYGSDVWHYAFFLTRSREQANDISQEVFLKAYKGIGKYRGEAALKTWLLTITRNTAFSFRRNSFWRRFIPLGDRQGHGQAPSAEKEAIGNQYASRIWEIIMMLPDKYREVLVLDIQQDLSVAEMSALLGIAQGTVKSRLARARDKVRTVMKEEDL
ncbi:RNA polymerase subunit sigma-70 [Paenibacillus riograndensis]|uniref:RNA polymerase subunit sigma-70 n=1 Tax=Paenibacillus riograndensis TaxID=483937 RepID=A0A132U0Z1_9BACL|nr:sigma-70 family RNA polymerase sigma factor [Paenibacillus riograndensis]KWX77036.1 RNA polymerase subunit sigma-70 [Paenibacillus riograndensis]